MNNALNQSMTHVYKQMMKKNWCADSLEVLAGSGVGDWMTQGEGRFTSIRPGLTGLAESDSSSESEY